MTYILMFILLLAGHAVADRLLQPGWLSVRKYDADPQVRWRALAIHGGLHALPVALVTGSPLLALAEMLVHPTIDVLKSKGWYGLRTDQSLHVLCKALWVLLCLTH